MSVAAFAALATVVALHLMLTFALIARVRTLQELLSGRGALPAVGTRVAAFETSTVDGARVTSADLAACPTVVGFFMPGCAPCDRMRAQLIEAPPALPVLAFVAGQPDDPAARTLAASLAAVARVAYSSADDLAHAAFRPPAFPAFYRIEDGQLAATGHTLRDVVP